MSDETVENGPSTPAQEPSSSESPALDLSAIDERMNALRSELQETLGGFTEQFQQFTSRFDTEDEEEYLDPDDPGYEDALRQQELDRLVNERVQQALTPIQEQQMVERRESAFNALTEKYSDLQDETVVGPIVKSLLDELGDRQDLINSPWFVRQIEREYLANKAREQAAREIPAGERKEVQLEGARGAAPQEPEEDHQDRLIRLHQQGQGLL